ncbi:MAG: hypothetical protein KBS81_11025, partial [Spirochaetales bacterium]|nr:hypothetical protein [Candidatus Physcosoma equi]
MDFLILKLAEETNQEKGFKRFFRRHNIIEYKSPKGRLSIDDYYKGLAYGCLYKATGRKEENITEDNLTLSFFRDRKPQKL